MNNIQAKLGLSPLDEYNQVLLSNAHPPDWVNPVPAAKYNIILW